MNGRLLDMPDGLGRHRDHRPIAQLVSARILDSPGEVLVDGHAGLRYRTHAAILSRRQPE
jgi:hypothetical protein